MNRRLTELFDQSVDYTKLQPNGTFEFNSTKFAELIVKECVDVANSKAEGIDLGSKLYLYKEDIEDTIKKHFGVEW